MPRVDFRRVDLAIRADLHAKLAHLRARVGAKQWEQDIPLAALTTGQAFPIPAALAAWQKSATPAGQSGRVLRRVTVEVRDPDLVALPWETVYQWDAPLVRVTPVRPHTGIDPFRLPLRIVQVGTPQTLKVPNLVYGLFGRTKPHQFRIHQAVRVETVDTPVALATSARLGPTSDVIHFESWAEFRRPNFLSFASISDIGTAAWLSRLCGIRQTRLVVLCCAADERTSALRLASALIESGGPAVLVESLPANSRRKFYRRFYSDLIHDFPLDSMLERALPSLSPAERTGVSLFAGAGREDELRVSTIGVKALRVHRPKPTPRAPPSFAGIPHKTDTQIQKVLGGLRQDWNTHNFEFHESEGLLPLFKKVHQIRSILKTVPGRFSSPSRLLLPGEGIQQKILTRRPVRELLVDLPPTTSPHPKLPAPKPSPGLYIPHAAGAGDAFTGMGTIMPPRRPRPPIKKLLAKKMAAKHAVKKMPPRRATPRPGPAPTPPQRFLNIAFWRDDPSGHLKEIHQKGATFHAGEVCQLAVYVGPQNLRIQVSDSAAIEEERFRWTPKMKGVWVEIAVTGIDFEVLGNPVREVWLPREGATERIFFPVIPKRSGVSRLRVCLYHNQDVIQSYRVAAITVSPGSRQSPAAQRRSLAAALGLPPEKVKAAGFLSRLEYSTGSVHDVANRSAKAAGRTLSIVANDWDSDTVITVKGAGVYSAQILADSDVPQRVQEIRDCLQAASDFTFKDKTKGYAFGSSGLPNGGTPDQLAGVLIALATPGWRLFDKLVLQDQRDDLDRALAAEDVTIHVAHILRDKVIPWTMLYDRPYDKNKRKDATGNPVAFGVCTASLPDENGELPVHQCFISPKCLLHGYPDKPCINDAGKTLLPETVVCPLHFWGFRHLIEVPPQQVQPGAKGITMPTEIPVEGKAHFIAGANSTLSLYDEHLKQMKALADRFPAAWTGPEFDRDKIIELLKDLDLSIIYFYCHAAGGTGSKLTDPELQFQGPHETEAGIITPDALAYRLKWARHPLVFLNGCGTVGYTPEALSPFVKKLVDDRGAAGIIGTEVPVWEQLASEIARRFFEMFLNRTPAGLALLLARRQVLAQNNPLGLNYTLYAAAELKLNFIK